MRFPIACQRLMRLRRKSDPAVSQLRASREWTARAPIRAPKSRVFLFRFPASIITAPGIRSNLIAIKLAFNIPPTLLASLLARAIIFLRITRA